MSKLFRPQAFGLSIDVKKFFFDRKVVQDTVGAQTAKKLGKIGGSIRLIARRSMRFNKGGNPSPPGTPPRYHTKDEFATLRNILYALAPDGMSVVVGPVKLNQLQMAGGRLQTGTVPAVHEFGGTVGIREKLIPLSWGDAVRRYGYYGGKQWVKNAGILSEERAKQIYGKNAVHRIDRGAGGVWVPVGRKRRDRMVERVRTARYPKRPYMQPALMKYLPKIPSEFEGMVRSV